ncbi:unnamed protein product [Meganyctiphanes norvegica]|uniref:DNA polymerase n=1 Tax=Meganyctiphanes norvegica TaxID=48144 RepID=A0AAV2QCB9_MEGNR
MSGKRKAPSSDDNSNADICDFLIELSEFEKNVNRNIHKYNAYRNGAAAIAKLSTRVKNGQEAMKLNGVGKQMGLKIDEFLATGTLKKLTKIRADDTSKGISLLTRVTGIGPAKARELVEQGIMTLDDMRNNQDKLNHHQIIGLKHMDDFELRIPRDEIEELEELLLKHIHQLDSEYILTIAGSYRRGAKDSGDIDGLLTHPNYESSSGKKPHLLKKVVDALKEANLVTDTLSLGELKFMGVCRKNEDGHFRRLDLRLIPVDQFYCGLLYFTGSDIFNKNMRTKALEEGFTLNEYCIRPMGATGVPGESLPVSSEEDVFDYVGMKYRKPSERKQ